MYISTIRNLDPGFTRIAHKKYRFLGKEKEAGLLRQPTAFSQGRGRSRLRESRGGWRASHSFQGTLKGCDALPFRQASY